MGLKKTATKMATKQVRQSADELIDKGPVDKLEDKAEKTKDKAIRKGARKVL